MRHDRGRLFHAGHFLHRGDLGGLHLVDQARHAGFAHRGQVGALLAGAESVVGHEGVGGNALGDGDTDHGDSGSTGNQTGNFFQNSHCNFSLSLICGT
ncbi:hypothetical protein D9M68_969940 [compost metagenome]